MSYFNNLVKEIAAESDDFYMVQIDRDDGSSFISQYKRGKFVPSGTIYLDEDGKWKPYKNYSRGKRVKMDSKYDLKKYLEEDPSGAKEDGVLKKVFKTQKQAIDYVEPRATAIADKREARNKKRLAKSHKALLAKEKKSSERRDIDSLKVEGKIDIPGTRNVGGKWIIDNLRFLENRPEKWNFSSGITSLTVYHKGKSKKITSKDKIGEFRKFLEKTGYLDKPIEYTGGF